MRANKIITLIFLTISAHTANAKRYDPDFESFVEALQEKIDLREEALKENSSRGATAYAKKLELSLSDSDMKEYRKDYAQLAEQKSFAKLVIDRKREALVIKTNNGSSFCISLEDLRSGSLETENGKTPTVFLDYTQIKELAKSLKHCT